MKLASYINEGRNSYGILDGDQIRDLAAVIGNRYPDLKSFIAAGLPLTAAAISAAPALAIDKVQFLPTIPNPEKIFCMGYNYQSHIDETGKTVPDYPFIFTRFADSQAGSGGALVRPSVSERFDYQGALAVVIGKPGRHIKEEDALDHVAGYACYNEASVRDWQKHTTQFVAGKNFPRTGGFGPWLATPDEIKDRKAMTIVTRYNGQEVQRESVGNMIFDIPAVIAYLSTFTPLGAGDVIVTGTPGGVGALHKPPLWLHKGVIVEVEIKGIGILVNSVVDEER